MAGRDIAAEVLQGLEEVREHRAGKRTLQVKAGPLSGSPPAVAGSRLPIGVRSFREIRERDCYYVDKTAHLACLAEEDRN